MDQQQNVFHNFEVPDPIRIKKALRFVRSSFPNVRDLNVLECGIAKGGLVDNLKKEGANCYGIDINPRSGVENITFFQKDLNEGFPELPVKFDIIFAGELMEHIYDDQRFVEQSKNLLKPGGVLIITVPNLVFIVNRLRMLFGLVPTFVYAPYHYHIYTKKTLFSLLEKCGLDIIGFTSSHLLFSTRRHKIGKIFEILGDVFPSLGAHLIVSAKNSNQELTKI